MSKYETVIGLEIHTELLTKSKIFCGCTTEFGGDPNSHCCPVCLGLPGALPVMNQQAIEYAVSAGLALNCRIPRYNKFDRKNYFYPDLPKAYQISQFDLPICVDGFVEYELEGERLRAGITRAHLEEEAGKSVHSGNSILGSDFSLMDYNRSGIPLIEIVTEPDLRSPAQARSFLEQLKSILEYTKVSDCKMQEGSLRCDANVSLRPVGSLELGTKVEIKNLNSFKAIERALEYEVHRQAQVYDQGGRIVQETRAWDDVAGITVTMRSKEESHDYRYFPDPDLVPIEIDAHWVERLTDALPELPLAKKQRFIESYGLSDYEAGVLTASQDFALFFEQTVAEYQNGKDVANWLMGEFSKLLNNARITITDTQVTPRQLAELLMTIDKGLISGTQGKEVLSAMFTSGLNPSVIIKDKGMQQISDSQALAGVVDQILADNPKEFERLQQGNEKLLGFFVGQVMKETKGKANPQVVNQIISERLRELS